MSSDEVEVNVQINIAGQDQVIEVMPFEAGAGTGVAALIVRASGPGERGEKAVLDISVANPRVTDLATLIGAMEELTDALRKIDDDEESN